jgi:hypothetical protein
MDIDIKLFAHINNDAFIAGTRDLEGLPYVKTIGFLQHFLSNNDILPTAELIDLHENLNSLFNNAQTIQNIPLRLKPLAKNEDDLERALREEIEPITKSIFSLPEEDSTESVLIPGGWNGKPSGHAMVYEFKRNTNGDLLFLIYNSGAGLNYHQNISSIDKERYKTVKCFKIPQKDVHPENISYFIAELVKPDVFPRVHGRDPLKEIAYNEKILYEQVFRKIAYLNGQEIDLKEIDPNNNMGVSMAQRSGTCTQKSLHQLIKHKVKDKQKTTLIIFCLKLYSIELFLNQQQNSLDPKKYSQLKWATENLSRIMLKQEKNIPPEIQTRAMQAIERVQKHKAEIEMLELEHEQKERENEKIQIAYAFSGLEQTKISKNKIEIKLNSAIKTQPLPDQDMIVISEKPFNLNKINHAEMAIDENVFSIEKLNEFIKQLDFLKTQNYHEDIEKNIFSYLTKLPLNKEYFSLIDTPEKALDYLDAINKILKIYIDSHIVIYGHTSLNPEIINLILSVTESLDLIYQHPNLSLLNGGVDNFFFIDFGNFNFFKKNASLNPYLATGSPELDARLKGILNRSQNLPHEKLFKPNSPNYTDSCDLKAFNQYLTKPENNKLKEYLVSLYYQQIRGGCEPVGFATYELTLIQNHNYQAVIAYLHYFEHHPAEFKAEANKLTFFKKTRSTIMKMIQALQTYDMQHFKTEIYVPERWVSASANDKSINENIAIAPNSVFRLNHEKEKSYFDKIVNPAIQDSLNEENYLHQSKLIYRENFDENQVFSTKVQNENDRLYQELNYLRNAPELQFLTTIDCFNDKLDLFTDKVMANKKDIQEYLRRVIFQPGVLNEALDKDSSCLETFNAFVSKAMLHCQKNSQVSADALYFYQLQADVNCYALNKPNYNEGLKDRIRKITFEQLKKLKTIDLTKISSSLDRYHLTKITTYVRFEQK